MTQELRVLKHLQEYGSITSWEAIEEYGATRSSAIIYNLRKKGFKIKTDFVSKKIDTAMLLFLENIYWRNKNEFKL